MSEKTEVAKITPMQEVCKTIETMEDKFKMALPPQMDPKKFVRVTMMAVQKTPDLANPEKVDRSSLYRACLLAAQDGLLPDGREAALVTFGREAVYMPMLGGILKKVRNSGELASITAQVIYKNDKFRFWIDGDGEHIDHEPLMFSDRGEAIGVYALAKTKDGAVYVEVMDKAQVEAVKKMARTKTVWEGAFGTEMWRKSAIRRLSKRLPMSTDLEQVIQRDDELYDLERPKDDPAPSSSGPRRLRSVIDVQPPSEIKEEAPI